MNLTPPPIFLFPFGLSEKSDNIKLFAFTCDFENFILIETNFKSGKCGQIKDLRSDTNMIYVCSKYIYFQVTN